MYYRRYTKPRFTDLGTPYVEMINKTGAASIKGTIVAADSTVDYAFKIPTTPYDIVAVVYENGKADGQPCKVVTHGLVDVLIADGTTAGRGGWVRASSDTYGRAINTTDPVGLGALAADDHFKEIGHSVQTVAAGVSKLCRIVFHQN